MTIDGKNISVYGLTYLKSLEELSTPKIKRPVVKNYLTSNGMTLDSNAVKKEAREIKVEFKMECASITDFLIKREDIENDFIKVGLRTVVFSNIVKDFKLFVSEKITFEKLNSLDCTPLFFKVKVIFTEPILEV
jgi:hypothetical protein